MKIIWPFSTDRRAGEAGNVLLLTGMLATATAVVGGKVMLDRTLAQRKASQLAENTKRAKEIPGSAAMIAKALISLPPNVARNKGLEWTTPKLVSTPANMPLIYPIPYVSGAFDSPAQPATQVDKTVNPPTGANWGMFESQGSSATVKVFTNDSSRTAAQDVSSAINSKAVVSGNDTLKRTESLVTYSFRNCDRDGNAKPSFTGRYCARAEIGSQNYAGAVKGSNTQSGENKAVAELGVIEPPPAPTCGAISTPGNVTVRPGDSFSLGVNATGVAVGYQVKYGATELLKRDMVSLPWNSPRASALHTITGIPTDPVKSALDALIASGINQATFEVVLQGVVSPTSCPVVVTLPGPVSCVPNSFTVTRIGDDLRTCQMSLQKDSGAGTITGITVGGQTFTGPAAGFSGSSWTGTMPCTEDAQTLTATLTRSVFGAVSMSICSPNRTVSELAADCVASSLDGGRDPNNLLRCNISLKRDQKSHSQVTVNTTPGLLAGSGSWGSSQNNDNSWTWQGVIDPCPFGSVTVTASLMRGSTPDSCGTKTITSLEPAKCNGPPTGWRNPSNSAECKISVNKFPSSGPIKHVIINGTNEPSSGNHPSPGAWGTSDSWTSPWFGCPLTATDYNLSLVGLDDAPSSCGRFTMPVNSYTLTTTVSGSGSISRIPDTATYNHGSTVTLTATPLVGHKFVSWSGACSGTTNSCTVTMNSNKSVEANFIVTTYSLTTSVNGSGSISRIPDTATYNHGSTVTLTAMPASNGYIFKNWSGDCTGTSTTCTVLMNSNKFVTATFDISNVCTQTVTYNPQEINCEIAISAPSFWDSVTDWSRRQSFMSNQQAKWISTQPVRYKSGGPAHGQPYCRFMPATDLITYVSHFKTGAGSTYKIEGIGDGAIQDIYIWKDGDPAQGPGKVNPSARACFVSNSTHANKNGCHYLPQVTLSPNTLYTIWFTVIESGTDFDGNASGGVLSVLDSSNGVLRQTDKSKTNGQSNWCVYRALNTTTMSTFVPNVARCNWCYRGRP